MPQNLIETKKPNSLIIATIATAIAVGAANILTLTGVLPVGPEIQTVLCLTPIVPVFLFIASLPGKRGRNKELFDKIARNNEPGVRSAKYNKFSGRLEINYGPPDEKNKRKKK